MTNVQYESLQETLQLVLRNQQVLNDNLTALQHLTELQFQTLDGKLALDRASTQLVDAHVEVVREEARLIKLMLEREVIPALHAHSTGNAKQPDSTPEPPA